MVEVTEPDITAALKQMGFDSVADLHYWARDNSELNRFDALTQAFAYHREAAAKAERDRLLTPASLEKIARSIGRQTVARDDRGILFDDLPEEDKATVLEMLAAALADALESKP